MATADKLTTVAENVPKVYHAGQLNVVENAECLKANKSGSAILIDDISPVSHEMGVKVRGKNLFDISKISSIANLTNNGDGTLTVAANILNTTINKKLCDVCPNLKVGNNIVFSFNSPSSHQLIYLQTSKRSLVANKNYIITQDDLDSEITWYGYQKNDTDLGNPCTISNIQIELGTTATNYTPYIPDLTAVKVIKLNGSDETVAEYTPTADGTVNGVTSLYPNTTLMTDTEGVIIDCDYYKDIDKAFNELTTSVALSGGE